MQNAGASTIGEASQKPREKHNKMNEYIYKDDNKYYRELTDLTGKSLYREEITESEYLSYKYAE